MNEFSDEALFRHALQQLADAVDGWEMEPAEGDPLRLAMDHARKVLKAAEEGKRLSSGKLVSERIIELLDEVEQRGLVPAEIIVGTSAEQLLRKEAWKAHKLMRKDGPLPRVQDPMYFHGLPVTRSTSEAAEYVGIECQQ
jgi:hypothetical protein